MQSSTRPPGTPTKFPDCFHFKSCLSGMLRLLLVLSVVVLFFGLRPTQAQNHKYKVLYSFVGPTGDGTAPGVLVREPNGTIYGTTTYGGLAYRGTVFELSPSGKESVLYNFNAGYGSWPNSLVPYEGKFWGATTWGGAAGAGAIFRLDENGNEAVLYSFPRNAWPGLYLVDSQGMFYGTTLSGGTYGYGTVFKIDSSGHLAILYSFTGGSDGRDPCCLVQDSSGSLYGYTSFPNSADSVFKLDSSGSFTTIYAFTGGADGYGPSAGPVLDSSGNLYGGTESGGTGDCHNIGCGVIFKLDPSGHETVLYNFTGLSSGVDPDWLIADARGNLYGTTWFGGDPNCGAHSYTPGCGVVFKLSASGKQSVLHVFHLPPDGQFPVFLMMDPAGDLYGMTFSGGDPACKINDIWTGCGTVFKLTP
jgi:uncharacterized repeat protein (TIGR03803 family)